MRPTNGEGASVHDDYTSVIPTCRSPGQQPQPALNHSPVHSKSADLDVRELKEYSSDKHLYFYAPNRRNNVYEEIDDDYFEPLPTLYT